jgi:2-polyprenyl-3-methyl-5-hydroxy-6-metoxy-1,4-benzoquinol methylase
MYEATQRRKSERGAMMDDLSSGWDGIADQFIRVRSSIGAGFVRRWARARLAQGAAIVDVGCGSGFPIAMALVEDGFAVAGIDASPRLIDAFQRNIPNADAACEAAQRSAFFDRKFDAAIAVGVIFLLAEEDQRALIFKVAGALKPRGHFLFSAPFEKCEWPDNLTGRQSKSLGAADYERLLVEAGFQLLGCRQDEGGNTYFDAGR